MSFGDLKVQDLIYEDASNNEITVAISNLATKANPTFTGTVTVPTAPASDVSTKAASTAFVDSYYATKASPTFTGNPTVPGYAPLSGATFTGTVNGTSLVLSADLTVNGTTTTINTQTLDVEDKNITLGKVSNPSDTTADGGGITLKGASDKTFNWLNATDAWTSSEHIALPDSKKVLFGAGTDLSIWSDGSVGIIQCPSSGGIHIGDATTENIIDVEPSQVILNKLLMVQDADFSIRGSGTQKILWDLSDNALEFSDSIKLNFGTGAGGVEDLQIYSNGTEGILGILSSGALKIKYGSSDLVTLSGASSQVDIHEDIVLIGGSGNGSWVKASSTLAAPILNATSRVHIAGSAGTSGQVLTSGGSGAAPSWAAVAAGGNTIELVADGAIAIGKPCIVTSAGKAKQVQTQMAAKNPITKTHIGEAASHASLISRKVCHDEGSTNYVLMVYAKSNYLYAMMYDVVNSQWKTEISTSIDTPAKLSGLVYCPTRSKFIVTYVRNWQSGSAATTIRTITNNGSGSLTFGSETSFSSNWMVHDIELVGSDKFFTVHRLTSNDAARLSGPHTLNSNGTFSLSTSELDFISWNNNPKTNLARVKFNSDYSKFCIAYTRDSDSKPYARAGSWNGSQIAASMSLGSEVTVENTGIGSDWQSGFDMCCDSGTGKYVIVYNHGTSGYANVITQSGTSLSVGTRYTYEGGVSIDGRVSICDNRDVSGVVTCLSRYPHGAGVGQFTISGSTLSSIHTFVQADGTTMDSTGCDIASSKPGTHYSAYVFFRKSGTNSNYLQKYLVSTAGSNLNSLKHNFIGFAPSAISDGATGTINCLGNTIGNQSGLTPGTMYKVGNDGTLSTGWDTAACGGTAISSSSLIIEKKAGN